METGFFNVKTTVSRIPHPFQIPHSPEYTRTGTLLCQCEVMFGSPSSNCGGNGICKIVAKSDRPASGFKRTSCSHARAFFTVGGDSNACLIFRRDWLCANLMRRYLRHGFLEMPEPCPLPAGIVSAFGLKINELPAGLHLIEDYGTHIRINFPQINLI